LAASVPLIVLPLTVTALAVPAFLSANAPLAAPPRVTVSPASAVIAAVPPSVAVVVVS